MTREEAIADIKNNIKPVVGGKSLDMAIEALSAEESVTLYATPKATYIRPLTEEIAIEFLQDSGCLVRCKDCEKRGESIDCPFESGFFATDDDDFCSCAKMKGGDDE